MKTTGQIQLEQPIIQKCEQRVLPDGRIKVSKKAWTVRITALVVLSSIIGYTIYQGLRLGDSLILYSTIMPMHMFLTLFIGWLLYKDAPKSTTIGNELVSVIVPVYNQKFMIKDVVEAIYESTYRNIEVIAVNDGSKDGTKDVLDNLSKEYPSLKVIHKSNEGKRKAVATGFLASKGRYIVLIDSDSIVAKDSIMEFVKTFEADPQVGAAVGHAKVLNSRRNFLTKCQDTWYDFSFNIAKGAESVYGCVTCCSGVMAAYRREAIEHFVPYWASTPITRKGDDKELTIYAIAPASVKTELRNVFGDKFWVPFSQKLMNSMSQYDDAEDRGLTAHALVSWKSVYVASAVVYTDVPDRWKGFLKQQTRWKKGFLRTNFFVNCFFWRKHPVISFRYYTEFIATMISPLVSVIILFYIPFVLGNWFLTGVILGASVLTGLVQGLDYRFRDPSARNWLYKPLMVMITSHVLAWLLIPALWHYRKNVWLTR